MAPLLHLPYGSKDPNNRVSGLKYHSIKGIWALKPHYLGPRTLRVIGSQGKFRIWEVERTWKTTIVLGYRIWGLGCGVHGLLVPEGEWENQGTAFQVDMRVM